MATFKMLLFIFKLIGFLLTFKTEFMAAAGIKAAYWPSMAYFPATSIDTSLFTHIYYAFLKPNSQTYQLTITQFDEQKIPELVNALHSSNPQVKILLSIGGGGFDTQVFSKMVSDSSTREIFIKSTIETARRFGFDGVDLDWETPSNTLDMSNLGLLFQQWRKAIQDDANASNKPQLLLTAAVYYASKITILDEFEDRSYPADAINSYLDWVSPMCYDYHGDWEKFTGAHSALYDPKTDLDTDFGIKSWIEAGIDSSKIVMGLPLYGKTWKLQDPNNNGIGAPAIGIGPGDGGILTYSQVVDFNTENRATIKFDSQFVMHYSYSGDSWLGYDDVESIRQKIQYAKAQKLGGYFFWALGQDKSWALSTAASNAWGS